MKVTVCEFSNEVEAVAEEWGRLVAHVRAEGSDLVLLPEMPFYPWIAWTSDVDPESWRASVEAHRDRIEDFHAMAPAVVAGTHPIAEAGGRFNEGFLWAADRGYRGVHRKYYLPEEEGFWEASWYQRGPWAFDVAEEQQARVGFLICTELWFTEHARTYARAGAHLVLCPRATEKASVDKWISGGRAAAVMAGAYCLSSNRSGADARGMVWGGAGWVIEPDGGVLALTSPEEPYVTVAIDLGVAEQAKKTYPRYVLE